MAFFPEGTSPLITDTQRRIDMKILQQVGGGGGGGSGQVLIDATGAPPPNPAVPAISYPTGGGGIATWDTATQQWI